MQWDTLLDHLLCSNTASLPLVSQVPLLFFWWVWSFLSPSFTTFSLFPATFLFFQAFPSSLVCFQLKKKIDTLIQLPPLRLFFHAILPSQFFCLPLASLVPCPHLHFFTPSSCFSESPAPLHPSWLLSSEHTGWQNGDTDYSYNHVSSSGEKNEKGKKKKRKAVLIRYPCHQLTLNMQILALLLLSEMRVLFKCENDWERRKGN